MRILTTIATCCALALSVPFGACTKEEDPREPRPVITRLTPSRGAADTTIFLYGKYLKGVSRVAFKGVSAPFVANFVSNDDSIVQVLVPRGITPGTVKVTVQTPGGLSESFPFQLTRTPTFTEVLAARPWRLVNEEGANLTGEPLGPGDIADLYAQRPPCTRDNLLIFGADGRLTFDEGSTRCATTDPQTVVGTWEPFFLGSGRVMPHSLIFRGVPDFFGSPAELNLIQLWPGELRVSYRDTTRGEGYTITRVYHNQ